ncbi:MAG: hypothetical protein LBK94_08205 [Prevotellaceae bacterium]|jgi:hypothetical protein|nr:hypothetical protein [Prevotellaceae bacterium]
MKKEKISIFVVLNPMQDAYRNESLKRRNPDAKLRRLKYRNLCGCMEKCLHNLMLDSFFSYLTVAARAWYDKK